VIYVTLIMASRDPLVDEYVDQVLRAVHQLSPADQRRLSDDLAKLAGVQLVRPIGSATAMRRGQPLVKKIQAEMVASTKSVDEVMHRLRGQSWSQ